MTRWIEIALFITLLGLGAAIYWWVTHEAPPLGGLAS